jgi:ADP-heptose:LPS heptosyltransferase
VKPGVPRIAVFRALQLGDMLCSVPALRALRAAYPHAEITLIGLPWARVFVERYRPLIDDLLVFPGAPGFPEQEQSGAGLAEFLASARKRRFDLALQMHGSGGIANDMVFAFGACECAGFVQPGESRAGRFLPWPEQLPEPERYLALMRRLRVPVHDAHLYFPLTERDHEECDRLLRGSAPARAAVVHPGAQLPSRRWPSNRFATVADYLARQGLDVVLTGTAEEAPLVASVAQAMRANAIDLAGKTTLGGLAALVSRARLVVCNDTGLSHLAAALQTPSVVVASGSDTQRWAPQDRMLHRVLAHYPPCRPCSHRVCPTGHECALGVSAEEVIAAVRRQLSPATLRNAA